MSEPGQRIRVSGSGNNIAVGAGAHAGNVSHDDSADLSIVALLEHIRSLANGTPDRVAGEQAQAAVSAIQDDLAKPSARRFSITGALAALAKLGDAIPGLTKLVEELARIIR